MTKRDILTTAAKHAISFDNAAPDFFQGALMGNGDMGVVVCTRPDAIALHFGHNDIWDIRIEEGHKSKIGRFDDIWPRILAAQEDVHNEPWYQQYVTDVTASYHDYIYPRPYPAGSVYLYFDRKEYTVMGHRLDIATGLLTINLRDYDGADYRVQVALSMQGDDVLIRTVDAHGEPVNIFTRLLMVPHEPDAGLPPCVSMDGGFSQLLPGNGFSGEVRPGVDRGFSLLAGVDGVHPVTGLNTHLTDASNVHIQLTQGYYTDVAQVTAVAPLDFDAVATNTAQVWADYWGKSGVMLGDEYLEHVWYVNTYFMRCLLNGHSRCPGLFGNWMLGSIGTAWHGDYHMNYNTQQIFWGLMGANRQEMHLPYVALVEGLMPVSTAWARDFYGLDGACFPHSAYPVPMSVMPYPSPDWGWEIFETPWTVQSLWWHYTYTGDKELLRTRLWAPLRAAATFLVGYMMRDGANPVGDDKYHLFPTIVPELYGLSEGLKLNCDGAVDLTLTKFLFKAVLQAVDDLDLADEEAELAANIRSILAAYPDYPTAPSRHGEVYVSVAGENPDGVIYNVPANLLQVFPGEDVDQQSAPPETLELARRSWRYHYNEGGNDLVLYHLIGARLGVIDVERFRHHVKYCVLPDGTATDRVTLTGGRYGDTMDFDFMARMGIWTENFSLYAVIDELLIRGHGDVIELFPCWDMNIPAAFHSMRAKGAYLVDAACDGGQVTALRVTSEHGGTCKIRNPWPAAVDDHGTRHTGAVIELPLCAGESIALQPERT